jgi:hypothetical protein
MKRKEEQIKYQIASWDMYHVEEIEDSKYKWYSVDIGFGCHQKLGAGIGGVRLAIESDNQSKERQHHPY